MPVYGPAPGLLIEGVGASWAVFSPLTGQTAMINDESASILEVLLEAPNSPAEVCRRLAIELEQGDPEALSAALDGAWELLRQSGLIVRMDTPLC